MRQMLIAMAGLPGSGKSTLAREVARRTGAVRLEVDAVEAAMWQAGVGGPDSPVPTGLGAYVVVEAIASDQLAAGRSVLVDAVNAAEPARQQWRDLAAGHRVPLRWLDVRCSDPAAHRVRLERRGERYAGWREPTWDDVLRRVLDPWPEGDRRILLDSAPAPDDLADLAMAQLQGDGAGSAAPDSG